MKARLALIEMMRRVLSDGKITNRELFAAVPDPAALSEIERLAWQRLSHWADDGDVRVKDSVYADMQRLNIAEALEDLEGLEVGYDPREIKIGEHQATHVPLVGCLAGAAILITTFYVMFAHGFFMHGD